MWSDPSKPPTYAEVKSAFGDNIWETMSRQLKAVQETSPYKDGMWTMQPPYMVAPGVVFGDGVSRKMAESPLSGHLADACCSQWFPALVSCNTPWSNDRCAAVLCKPLLEMNCRRPWKTHLSRVHVLEDDAWDWSSHNGWSSQDGWDNGWSSNGWQASSHNGWSSHDRWSSHNGWSSNG